MNGLGIIVALIAATASGTGGFAVIPLLAWRWAAMHSSNPPRPAEGSIASAVSRRAATASRRPGGEVLESIH